jgi:hypothetical protein
MAVKRLAPEQQFRLAPSAAMHVHASNPDGTYTDVLLSSLLDPIKNTVKDSIVDETYDSMELTAQNITDNSATFVLTPLVAGSQPVRRICDANGQFGIVAPSTVAVAANGAVATNGQVAVAANGDLTVTVTGFADELQAGGTLGLKCVWKMMPSTGGPVPN